MEDNIDSIKESRSNEEEALKKVSTNNKLDQSTLKDKPQSEDVLNPINQNANNVVSNEINNNFDSSSSTDLKIKQKKEIPIEKKPFKEFINDHLLPSIIHEIKERGFEVNEINLKNTKRPIAGDICWVIYCEINDICNFWLSFEKEDISSLKSISLCKSNQKPSVIESFLIDEKRITLKLIISRILQRLNGQKLIGTN